MSDPKHLDLINDGILQEYLYGQLATKFTGIR
jgi:hypothetical protein